MNNQVMNEKVIVKFKLDASGNEFKTYVPFGIKEMLRYSGCMCLHEKVVNEWVKAYFDFDQEYKTKKEVEDKWAYQIDACKDAIKDALGLKSTNAIDCLGKNPRPSKKHKGMWRMSLHFIVNDGNLYCKKDLKRAAFSEDFDKTVYTNGHTVCMAYGYKNDEFVNAKGEVTEADKEPFKAIDCGNDDCRLLELDEKFEDTDVTPYDIYENYIISIGKGRKKSLFEDEAEENEEETGIDIDEISSEKKEQILTYIEGVFGEKVPIMKPKIKHGTIIFPISNAYECPKHHRRHSGNNMKVIYNPKSDKLTFNCHHEDNEEEKELFHDIVIPLKSEIEEKKEWFYNDFHTFIGKNVTMQEIEEWASQSIVEINQGESLFIVRSFIESPHDKRDSCVETKTVKKSQLMTALWKKVFVLNSDYDPAKPIDKKVNKQFSFELLAHAVEVLMMEGKIRTFTKQDFIPYLGKSLDTGDTYNLFQGFKWSREEPVPSELFEKSLIIKHLRDELMDGNEEHFKYLMSYIAHMIQKPQQKPKTFILLYSPKQGTGKDFFYNFCQLLIGQEYTVSTNDTEAICKKHNANQIGKLLIRINENSENGGWNNADKMKDLIDCKDFTVEPKGIDPFQIKNYARWFGFTNHENSLKIEVGDRRYFAIKTSVRHANERAYWDPLWAELNDLDIVRSAFNYFSNYDIENWAPMVIPKSKLKTEMIKQQLPNPIQFIMDSFSDYDEKEEKPELMMGEDEKNQIVERKDIEEKELYEKYKSWCDKNACGKKFGKKTFNKCIEERFQFVIRHHRRYFCLNKQIVEEKIQELTGDPECKL